MKKHAPFPSLLPSRTASVMFPMVFFVAYAAKWYIAGFAGRMASQIILLGSMLGVIALSMLIGTRPTASGRRSHPGLTAARRQAWIFLAYIILVCTSLIRSVGVMAEYNLVNMLGRTATVITIALLAESLIRCGPTEMGRQRVWHGVMLGLFFYTAVNIGGAALGIHNPFTEELDLIVNETIFGFTEQRVVCPFSPNPGSFATEAGMLSVLGICLVHHGTRRCIVIGTTALVLGLAGVVAGDSRTPLLAVVAALGFLLLPNRSRRRPALILGLLLPVFPLLMATVDWSAALRLLPFDVLNFSRRADINEILTLNNRTWIWTYLFDEIRDPKFVHFVGYGAFGHVASGLAFAYGYMWPHAELISLHNAALQHLVDIGYLGLAVFVVLMVHILASLTVQEPKRKTPYGSAPLALIVYLVVCSFVEVTPYFNKNLPFLIFCIINMHVILPFGNNKTSAGQTGTGPNRQCGARAANSLQPRKTRRSK